MVFGAAWQEEEEELCEGDESKTIAGAVRETHHNSMAWAAPKVATLARHLAVIVARRLLRRG